MDQVTSHQASCRCRSLTASEPFTDTVDNVARHPPSGILTNSGPCVPRGFPVRVTNGPARPSRRPFVRLVSDVVHHSSKKSRARFGCALRLPSKNSRADCDADPPVRIRALYWPRSAPATPPIRSKRTSKYSNRSRRLIFKGAQVSAPTLDFALSISGSDRAVYRSPVA